MFHHLFLFALVISAEKLTEDPNPSVPSMPSESVSESLAPKVFNIVWSELPCENLSAFLSHPRDAFNSLVFVLSAG